MQFNLQIIDTRMTFTTKADAWPIFKLCLGAISCFHTTQGPLIPRSAPQESRAGKSSGWIGWRRRLLLGPKLGLKTMQVTFLFNQYNLFKQSHRDISMKLRICDLRRFILADLQRVLETRVNLRGLS